MSEMVERVAKALIDDDPTMFGYHESHIRAKESAARAAIAAMREPTPEMINSTWASSGDIRAWQAMIDEILK